ncbi:CBS domain-containing protein, partial [Acinetobacter baumannii]|uniref:CBS domain-containing protein n=1 Tax=Acinetobacter baumannii TaxID=470 RepID=UPI001C1268E9
PSTDRSADLEEVLVVKIKDVIRDKPSHDVITIVPDATVQELVALLAEHNVGAVVVSSDRSTVEGIVSERDVVRRLHDRDDVLGATVAEIMTTRVRTCEPEHDLDALMALMTEHRIRHVPVVEDARLVGVVSIG